MVKEYGELKPYEDGWAFQVCLHDGGGTDTEMWATYLVALNKLAEEGWAVVSETVSRQDGQDGEPVRCLLVRERPDPDEGKLVWGSPAWRMR